MSYSHVLSNRTGRSAIPPMSRRMPSLNAARAFEVAARHLSFSHAANELGVTQGAISRQVKALEEFLGIKLFHRLTRAIELTEAGQEYHVSLRDAFDRIEQATQRITNRGDRQVLTVGVLPTFAMHWLIPRLGAFMEANASVEVRFVTSIIPVNFAREDIDVAIRVGSLDPAAPDGTAPRIDLKMVEDWAGVRADLVASDVLVPVCSPGLYDGSPPLNELEHLRQHTLLHTSTRPRAWPDWLGAVGMGVLEHEDEPAFGHFFMTLQAATQGLGVAIVPEILVAKDLDAGTLVKPFDAAVESAGAYYLLCRQHQWDAPKVRAFREWLLSEAAGAKDPDLAHARTPEGRT